MYKIIIGLSFLLMGLICPAFSLAQQTEKDLIEMLKERDAEIKELLGPEGSEYSDEQRKQIKEIVNGIIDFEAMAQASLAQTYDTISQDLREEFVDLFSLIIQDQSLNRLDIYRADVTYETVEVDEDTARVETIAQLDNVRTPVNYDMQRKNETWVITDMEIDDVSTVDSYHRQFQRIITKRGFDVLMDSLRKRAAR